ncbi:maintenance of telomere capping protein 1 [Fomitopsis serialis]|uniref:maintenance of telomere capping protein 1 n=1 Tax=Fomitopsis serialis TaxID=139415 RepID=UPI002007F6D9|nr:maintenance of telomere capping protein 1 [Neoantrodia serialis]KAH9937436.1 maintenance of telomere capping protein 1 [Neoantrodia serialis]
MASKSKSKQEEALQFLDDLDSLAPPGDVPESTQGSHPPGGEAEVYAFIDEITQKSSEPPRISTSHIERPLSRAGTPGPTVRKSTERVRVGAATPLLPTTTTSAPKADASGSRLGTPVTPNEGAYQEAQAAAGGWGWGSVWTSASAAIQQAKTVVDEQVKKNEQARKWSEGVLEYAKNAQLNKLGNDFKRVGLSTLTDILNVVAPPISEHEVIQVWLSHDMAGYDGVESLVYRALSRIMEQVEGGDLVVNRGDESRPKESTDGKRELNAVEGFEAALKLAQANIDEIIKRNAKPLQTHPTSAQNPTTYSYVYVRIQPYLTTFPLPQPSVNAEVVTPATPTTQTSLQFLIYLSDPTHQLNHSTVTQAVPGNWLDFWDEYEWVEDLVVEAIRVGVEVIGQEYVVSRMGWSNPTERGPQQPEPTVEETTAA